MQAFSWHDNLLKYVVIEVGQIPTKNTPIQAKKGECLVRIKVNSLVRLQPTNHSYESRDDVSGD